MRIQRKLSVMAAVFVLTAVAGPLVVMLARNGEETIAVAPRAAVLAKTHVADNSATILPRPNLFARRAPDEVSMLLVGTALIGLGAVLRRAA